VAKFTRQFLSLPLLIHGFNLFLISGTTAIAFASNSDVVLYASRATLKSGTWTVVADSTAAGGRAMANPDLGAQTITAPLAQPVNYFQLSFPAHSGTPYHLWIRGKSAENSINEDSVFVQFSDSVTSNGSATHRIGTTSGMAVILQSCTASKVHGWGWTDNGWCGLGANVFFQNSGTHTIRIQVRQEGLSIDQIVLSPQTYVSTSPGKAVNDTTILAANLPVLTATIQVTTSASPSSGGAPLDVSFTPNV
jgi:hypothetical protein